MACGNRGRLQSKATTILLADPPFADRRNMYAETLPNLGLLYLYSSLRRELPNLRVLYMDGRRSRQNHLDEVSDIRPCIYGISFASPYAELAYTLINEIKTKFPSTLVVCGGAHPTAEPIGVLENSEADVCCMSEGEQTIVEIVKSHLSQGDITSVSGIAYKATTGEIKVNPNRPLVTSLDGLPFPAWDAVDLHRFSGCRKRKGRLSAAIVASRGCPFNCTFCSNPVWKLQKPWLRKRSPQNIAKEVALLYEQGVREIYIRSDEMNPEIDWAIAVFEALADLSHADLFFQCNLRARPISDRLAKALSRANCWLVHLGIESGSQRVLDGIKKELTLEEIQTGCETLKKYNIRIHAFMMLCQVWEQNGQLQVETTRDMWRSLWTMLTYRWKGFIDYMSWSCAAPLPGSELYRVARKYNLIKNPPPFENAIIPHEISLIVPGATRSAMALLRTLGLIMQGIFLMISRDFRTKKNLLLNLGDVLTKVKYIFRFR